jgi:hypothetical protein
MVVNDSSMIVPKIQKKPKYVCECGKKYMYDSGYYRHKKTCINDQKIVVQDSDVGIIEPNNDIKTMLMTVMKENNDLKKIIFAQSEQISNMIPLVGSNNNTTIHKQKFNINLFLNEKCKDAINIDDFIKQIEIGVKDLLLTKAKGLAEGVSNIFIENMNKLSLYERPIHCTDIKRETIYIKNNEWKKDEDKNIVKRAIKEIASKQVKNIIKYKDENPNYMDSDTKKEEFINIVKETTFDIDDSHERIIKNICKDTHISEN